MKFLLCGRSNTVIFVRHVLNDSDVLSLNKLCDMLKPFEYKWLCDKRFLSSGTSPLSEKRKYKRSDTNIWADLHSGATSGQSSNLAIYMTLVEEAHLEHLCLFNIISPEYIIE